MSEEIKDAVRSKYGSAAQQVIAGATGSCCGSTCGTNVDPITRNLYDNAQTNILPEEAVNSTKARLSLILDQVAELTFFFQRGVSVLPEKPTDLI
jgi:hypothetical protein